MKSLEPHERVRRIESFLREQSGESDIKVRNLRRMAGGSSRQVWSLDVDVAGDTLALVLRVDPTPLATPGLAQQSGFLGEFRLLQAARRFGVPVPEVHWSCEDNAIVGGPFYLMDRIEGETIARRILRSPELEQARAGLPAALGAALGAIHRIDLDCSELEGLGFDRVAHAREQIAQIRLGIDQAAQPVPTLELAFRWLERHLPADAAPVLVHGDFRVGNIVVGPDGLRAVLDWELAHAGDPHEDLAWICAKTWRFGQVEHAVGGLGDREPFLEAYERARGVEVDREALRFWDLLAAAKVGIVWIFQLAAYRGGSRRNVEHATIGRRMAETDLDLVELLDALP